MATTSAKPKTKKENVAQTTNSFELPVYDSKGKETGKVSLNEGVFGVKWNADLVHQVIVSAMSSSRSSIAHTKTRGEVSGGGKKPWRQKGTGRARHGSTRSPIWVGGGVAHGPRSEKNYDRKINKTMKSKALSVILSKKLKDGEIVLIDSITFSEPKTKEAKKIVSGWKSVFGLDKFVSKNKNAFVLAIPEKDGNLVKSFQNFGNVSVEEIRNINPVSLLKHKGLVILDPKKSLETLYTRFGVSGAKSEKKAKTKQEAK